MSFKKGGAGADEWIVKSAKWVVGGGSKVKRDGHEVEVEEECVKPDVYGYLDKDGKEFEGEIPEGKGGDWEGLYEIEGYEDEEYGDEWYDDEAY